MPQTSTATGSPSSPCCTERELPPTCKAWLDQQERDILVRALQENGFNRTATAARLGISLRQIRYRIARLHIPTPQDGEPCTDTDDPHPPEASADSVAVAAASCATHSHCPRPTTARAHQGGFDYWWCIHQPATGEFGTGAVQQLVHQPARLGCPPYPASVAGSFGALFITRSGQAVGSLSIGGGAPGTRGVSSYRGRERCNDDSIGIELEGLEGSGFGSGAQYACLANAVPHTPGRTLPGLPYIAGHEHCPRP